MCQTCGCTPCTVCEREIDEGVCEGCDMPSDECICQSLEDADDPIEDWGEDQGQ